MHPILAKTFGGLSARYYVRQFLFGLIFFAFSLSMLRQFHVIAYTPYILYFVSTLLYPYSRFVYESVVGYIMGENVFFVNAGFMLMMKFMTMLLCWACAILIAPFGLLYLYIYHSRSPKSDQ